MPLNSQEPQHTWLNSEHNGCCSCGWRCAFNGSGMHFDSRCKQAHMRHVEYGIPTIPEDTPEQKAADLLAEFQEHESEQAQTFDEFMQEEPGHAL